MSIATEITRLNTNKEALATAKTAIASAITTKGGTVASGDGFADFATDIASIPSGGRVPKESDILVLYDCYGNIIASYNQEEALALTHFPEPPEHEGLRFYEYNWTIAEMKAEISVGNKCNVGACYGSDDNTFQIHITLDDPTMLSPVLNFSPGFADNRGAKSTIELDWGDGSPVEEYVDSAGITDARVYAGHIYQNVGSYVIRMKSVVGGFHGPYGDRTHGIVDSISGEGAYYRNKITKIVCDDLSGRYNSGLQRFVETTSAEYIVQPTIRTGTWTSFVGPKLKFFVVPRSQEVNFGSVNDISYDEVSRQLFGLIYPGNKTTYGTANNINRNCYSLRIFNFKTGLDIPNGYLASSGVNIKKLPPSITSIGSDALRDCKRLELEELSDSVTSVGSSAFAGCASLTLKKLPSSITSIGDAAFDARCGNCFTEIPSGVSAIGNNSFRYNNLLRQITFLGTPESISSNSFNGCNNLKDIYVPWAENEVANAPWGATNATIHYNHTLEV